MNIEKRFQKAYHDLNIRAELEQPFRERYYQHVLDRMQQVVGFSEGYAFSRDFEKDDQLIPEAVPLASHGQPQSVGSLDQLFEIKDIKEHTTDGKYMCLIPVRANDMTYSAFCLVRETPFSKQELNYLTKLTQPVLDHELDARNVYAKRKEATKVLGSDYIECVKGAELENRIRKINGLGPTANVVTIALDRICTLGEGAQGKVELCLEKTDIGDGEVAKKELIIPSMAEANARVEMFKKEADIVKKLQHTNIVNVLYIGFDWKDTPQEPGSGKIMFYVTEYVKDGMTLRHLLSIQNHLEPWAVVDYMHCVADAVMHAHSQNILHLDIKPDNVLITPGGVIKVSDWGLAKMVTDLTGTFGGTMGYIAPEDSPVHGNIPTEKSDSFGMGSMFYELLTGRQLLEDIIGANHFVNLANLTQSQLDRKFENTGVYQELMGLVKRCTLVDPRERLSPYQIWNETNNIRKNRPQIYTKFLLQQQEEQQIKSTKTELNVKSDPQTKNTKKVNTNTVLAFRK